MNSINYWHIYLHASTSSCLGVGQNQNGHYDRPLRPSLTLHGQPRSVPRTDDVSKLEPSITSSPYSKLTNCKRRQILKRISNVMDTPRQNAAAPLQTWSVTHQGIVPTAMPLGGFNMYLAHCASQSSDRPVAPSDYHTYVDALLTDIQNQASLPAESSIRS
jgi:hypothetical protein